MGERNVLVLADSLAFHGPERIESPTDPRLYPHVCATHLHAQVDLLAREGWTSRDGWWALTKDPVAYGVYLPRADFVVIGLGGMDQLPASIPVWLRQTIPYVRPGGLRRRLRAAYRTATPPIIKATKGMFRQVPQQVTDRYLTRIIEAIRVVRPEIPIVLLAPTPYDSRYYPAGRHHAGAVASARQLADRLEVGLVDPGPFVLPGLRDGSANPDGMHWSWQAHASVGRELAEVVGSLSRP
ncbi:MAG TPA: SGNH/GDSL hydrolase family protein [Candidatus Nanopelagicales bacterium]|nr:SGNH/GDSL hydrolase family protein [Candidatus Nanopelagicales bacterium]